MTSHNTTPGDRGTSARLDTPASVIVTPQQHGRHPFVAASIALVEGVLALLFVSVPTALIVFGLLSYFCEYETTCDTFAVFFGIWTGLAVGVLAFVIAIVRSVRRQCPPAARSLPALLLVFISPAVLMVLQVLTGVF